MVAPIGFERVGDIVSNQAAQRPNAVATIFEGEEVTYREWDDQTNQIANGLLGFGMAPQTRIAIMAKNSADLMQVMFGAAKADAVPVGVNWRLAPPEVAYVINDAQAEVLFVGDDFFDLIEGIRGDLTTVKHIIALEGAHPDWPAFRPWREAQDQSDPALEIDQDAVALQLYTSGTTGHPKGVQMSHRNFQAFVGQGRVDGWGVNSADDVNLVCMPMFHVAGTNLGLIGLSAGCLNIVLREPDPQVILDVIPRYGITRALFVPAVILLLLQQPESERTDFSSLKTISYGASPIPLDLLRDAMKVIGCEFIQLYGMTENTGTCTNLPASDHDPDGNERMRSCGKANTGVEIKIIDGDGNALPPREVGEIIMKSQGVMRGYWNLPEATASAIVDGWLYTGDAGYFDEDGYLYIHDRLKDMIVSGGENIYPAEVESALFGHPAISDVAVIGVPDDKWGEGVKAIVHLKEGATLEADELIAYAREKIAGYKVPKSIDFYPEPLPRNPSGKLLKRVLREPYWEGRDRQIN